MTSLLHHMLLASLPLLALCQLCYLHWQLPGSATASIASLLLFIIAALPRLKLRERILLSAASVATLAAITLSEAPLPLIRQALLQAAFLTTFMVLLSLLREGAITSPAVLTLGEYLTSRKPGRRYIAIHLGSQLLGMFLNFGALTLLGPLIQRGARTAEHQQLASWRERRQLSALVRGFSWTIAWSPATVTIAITVSVVAGAKLWLMCLCGLCAAGGSLLIGWLLDRKTGHTARRTLASVDLLPTSPQHAKPFPVAAAGRIVMVCASLCGIALTMIALNQVSIVKALMFASPIVTALWIWQQQSPRARGRAFTAHLRHIVTTSIPAGIPEAVTLAAAGYVGVITVALINSHWLAEVTNITALPVPYLYILVLAAVPLLSNLALPPILTVTVIGSLYSTLPFANTNPTLLACALSWGWAINLTASPFGGVPLILGRITNLSSTTLSWRWNGVFSIAIFCWCATALTILSLLLAPN